MNINMKINLALDKPLWDAGIRYNHKLNLASASWLTFGPSGSGKSVLNKLIAGRIASIPDTGFDTAPNARARVTICDGKADDYTFLRDVPNARYYEYLDVQNGLTTFFNEFEDRLHGNPDRSFRLIVLEEWSSYLRVLENSGKEGAQAAKTSLSQAFSITSQGRAYNTHCLFSVQRPDSQFLSGFRENLTTIIGLGRISPEAARMVGFNEYELFSNNNCGQSNGWLLDDTGKFAQIIVPRVKDFNKLHRAITDVVTR